MSANLLSFDCFASEEICQRTSSADKMVVISGESQIWRVQLHNLSASASCQIVWRLTSESDRAHFDEVTFSVRNSQEEVWEGSLQKLVDQNFTMQTAFPPTSMQELQFTFIFKQQQDWQLLFDLHLDLTCQESDLEEMGVDLATNKSISLSPTQSPVQAAVLGASAKPAIVASASTLPVAPTGSREAYWPWAFCLCAFIFFVIIKLINGKKKKSRQSFASLKQQKN